MLGYLATPIPWLVGEPNDFLKETTFFTSSGSSFVNCAEVRGAAGGGD